MEETRCECCGQILSGPEGYSFVQRTIHPEKFTKAAAVLGLHVIVIGSKPCNVYIKDKEMNKRWALQRVRGYLWQGHDGQWRI